MLPALYRGHDALLFTSRYEAWGMPVLEGMASGLPVVATTCLGVQTFAQHGVNALLADPQVPSHAETAEQPLSVLVRMHHWQHRPFTLSKDCHYASLPMMTRCDQCRMCHSWHACC